MTIENYFERRIRPIVDEVKKPHNSSHNSNSMIDEDQLARTFQEIVNCINLDDDSEDDKILSKIGTNSNQSSSSSIFSRSHSLLPELNSIFGGPMGTFNIAVGSGEIKGNTVSSASDLKDGKIPSFEGALGKSFLDDDWFPSSSSSSSSSNPSPTSVKKSSEILSSSSVGRSLHGTRPLTPTSTTSGGFSRSDYFSAPTSSSIHSYNIPPSDYVCKLCNCDGHWMKDCRLYEPRTPPASISSFKSSTSSSSMSLNNFNSSSNNNNNGNRTLLPPGNYVCRLCNVAGHWIDQCAKFQPKNESSSENGNSNSPPVLPPMLGPGPTPNYRPPAYLSKPVPSNYICNLCNRPGHWIQQCTEFTPIINHKPHSSNKY